MNATHRSLLIKIKTKGYYEQERGLLFSGLYGNSHVVTRNTRGYIKQIDLKILKSKQCKTI